jgi:hypothetical protein
MTAEQVVYSDQTYCDFEELCEQVKGWGLDFTKLDTGNFTGTIKQFITPNYAIGRATFHNRLKQAGMPPPGLRTFVIPAKENFSMI